MILIKLSGLSLKEANEIIDKLVPQLEEVVEDNEWLLYHGKSGNFNVFIYKNKSGKCKVVHNDEHTLKELLQGKGLLKSKKPVVWIDDAGWGCPLGGVIMGAFDEKSKRFVWGEVDVSYFQGEVKKKRRYLEKVKDVAEALLISLGVERRSHRIQICSGHVNEEAKNGLREIGFEVHMDLKVEDPLQTLLEEKFSEYLEEKYGFNPPKNGDYRDLNLAARRFLRRMKDGGKAKRISKDYKI